MEEKINQGGMASPWRQASISQDGQVRGATRENGVLCPKDTALGAASVLEGLLANIALCPTTPEIRRLFTAGTPKSR